MKRVVLVFHAHEPFSQGERLAVSPLGRLVAVAEALDAPISLAISNELVHQLGRDLPSTFEELKRGFASGRVRCLYTPAHHAPAALLSPDELDDELRLNEECLHELLGAPRPSRRGVLFAGAPVEPRLVPVVEARGYDFTFCEMDADGTLAGSDPEYDYAHQPFRVGERLMALPLVKLAGAPDAELLAKAIAAAVEAAPDEAVLGFLHPLVELEAVRQAWGRLRAQGVDVEFVAPEQLLDPERVTPSWLPELRLASVAPDTDGAGDGPFQGWEGGRFVTATLEWLVEAFGFPRTPPLAASTLFEEDYRLERLPPRAQVPMLLRMVKSACSEGLDGHEGMSRRPYLDGFRICDALALECRLSDSRPGVLSGLDPSLLSGLSRLPELIVDPRIAYREVELEHRPCARALGEVAGARRARLQADEEIVHAQKAYDELRVNQFHGRARWRALVIHVRDHLGYVCVALDHLERAAQGSAAHGELEHSLRGGVVGE